MDVTRRHLIAASSAAAFAGALPKPSIAQPAKTIKTIKFIPLSDLTGIDPIWTTSTAVRNHGYLVYDTLFGTDANFAIKPQMAEGYEVSADGLITTIRLRDGLRFHDGAPVLARDCVASIKRWAARDGVGQMILAVTDELSAPDDKTIRFRLKTPFPRLIPTLGQLSSPAPFMMPESVALTDPQKQITSPIGSGPFRFLPDEWVHGSKVAYAKFDGYVPRAEPASGTAGGKRVYVDRVEWNIVPDSSTAMSALQTGSIDWYEYAAADLLPVVAKNPDLVITSLDPVGYPILMRMNQLQPPFNSEALRRALLMAVDQNEFLQAAIGDQKYASVCKSFMPCGTPMSIGAGSEAMKGDIAAARKAVAESGYDGAKAVILTPGDNPIVNACANVAADLLKKIGINAEMAAMDLATMIGRRTSMEPVEKGGWSIFFAYGESAQFSNPSTHIGLRADGKTAWPGWPTDQKLQDLRRAWLEAPTEAAQKAVASDIEKEAFSSVPYIPVGQFRQPTVYRRALSGVIPSGISIFWNIQKA